MAANPRSAPNLPPTIPFRAPSTDLSAMIHPAQSSAGSQGLQLTDPSAVMLRPLHQPAHGGTAAGAVLSQPIEYSSYQGQEISAESQLGPAEIAAPTPEQKMIDPVLTVEAKSNEKVH